MTAVAQEEQTPVKTPEPKTDVDEEKCNGEVPKDNGDTKNDAESTVVEEENADEVKPTEQEQENDAIKEAGADDDDDDVPIPSGFGSLSKDVTCSPQELQIWTDIIKAWHSNLDHRPRELDALIRQGGIPGRYFRGEIWFLMSGAHQSQLMDQYRILITSYLPESTEQMILRDCTRTYPANENFQTGGSSSLLDPLFKVCKAYAVYDEEVGYCQGATFLVAVLLLHMPEEQAFGAFTQIMQKYGLTRMFKNNFEDLHLKFYQLERLLEDQLPDLFEHFVKLKIQCHMFGAQWFLSLYTAKFPFAFVTRFLDMFFYSNDLNMVFRIALALLSSSKQDLLDFRDIEGVLRYFRVQMPKLYMNEENVEQVISASSKVNLKKLKKYARDYEIMKREETLVTRLQRENAILTDNNLRLERENDDLAREILASKIENRTQQDGLEDKIDKLSKALSTSRQECQNHVSTIDELQDEMARLRIEVTQLKDVCRREIVRTESELTRNSSIIADYKKICSQLSKRLDAKLVISTKFIETVGDLFRDNESCKDKLCYQLFAPKAEEFLKAMNSPDNQEIEPAVEVSAGDVSSPSKASPTRKVSTDSERSANRPVGAYIETASLKSTSSEAKIQQLTKHIEELELELARVKVENVEMQTMQMSHEFNAGVTFNSTSQPTTSLAGKLEFMKAAVSSVRRSPKSQTSTAFAKINNLISDRISN